MQLRQAPGGHHRERVDLGLELEQGAQELPPGCLVAQVGGLDDDELTAAERWAGSRGRRKLEQAADRGHLVGAVRVHSAHAASTSPARSIGQSSHPANASAIG